MITFRETLGNLRSKCVLNKARFRMVFEFMGKEVIEVFCFLVHWLGINFISKKNILLRKLLYWIKYLFNRNMNL